MKLLSHAEIDEVIGGFSMFEVSASTAIWGTLIAVWKNDPVWLFSGLITGVVLNLTKVADQSLGFENNTPFSELSIQHQQELLG